MTAPSPCPPPERWRQLLQGIPPATEQDELIAHLDDCTVCRQLLEKLTGANPALLDALPALTQSAYTEEAPLRRVLDDIAMHEARTILHSPLPRAAWIQSFLQPSESPDVLGRLEQYDVTELLGQGGMGLVVKGFDPALKRWVAIKVLAPELARDSVARQRFAREAQATATVRHEHVITIHAVSEANGLPFFVMEFIPGGSLQDYLDAHGPPEWGTIARLGAEIASGLAAAHAHGLIHRDIKPSNILLEPPRTATEPGAAKIGDFGLARVADDSRLTLSGTVAGTPMYMSPEQAQCETLDARTDLFSLGSVLYVLCTGRQPFPTGTLVAVLRHVCETTPPSIRALNPAIPEWLAALVERLHAKRPADRLASAAEVAEILRYNLEHPDQPRLVAPPHPVAQPRRKKYRVLVAALAALFLAAGGLALSEALHWTHLTGWRSSEGGQEDRVPLRATLHGHRGPVWAVSYAPDGQTLATGSDDGTLRLWGAATGHAEAVLSGHGSAVVAVAYAHSGKFLVSGGADGTLHLWDPASHQEQRALEHHGANLRRLALSPDDKTVALAGSAQEVELWDLDTHTRRLTLEGHHSSIVSVVYAPDGQTLATGDVSGHIRLWDPATGDERGHFRGDPLGLRALAFAPDSQTLASAGTGGKDVKLWQVATHQEIAALAGYENGVQTMKIAPNGRFLATGGRDGSVKLWDVPSASVLATLQAHEGAVWAVAFSPDSRTLATVGEDRLGKLWDLGSLVEPPP
jgi:hypothetical protein